MIFAKYRNSISGLFRPMILPDLYRQLATNYLWRWGAGVEKKIALLRLDESQHAVLCA